MANNRRPQAPKRRNFVAKNVGKFNRPQTFRDRTKYDRYEDYLSDQLDDYIADIEPVGDAMSKEEFVSKISGEEYDPDMRKEYEDWLDAQGVDDNMETWDYHDLGDDDDTYDDPYDGYEEYDY